MVYKGVQKHDKRMSSNPQEIQNKNLIRKSKQIQTIKNHQRSQKDPPGELSLKK